jgi:hypothetical protein
VGGGSVVSGRGTGVTKVGDVVVRSVPLFPLHSLRPRLSLLVRKVLKRRIVTTFVSTPGRNSVSASGAVSCETSTPGYAPVTTSAS